MCDDPLSEVAALTCGACGAPLDPAEAIAFRGQRLHDSCYFSERFADPDALTSGPDEAPTDVSSEVIEAIAVRGIEVVAHL